ncbi:MAG: DUF1028 domain-containing protein [Gemmatimonadetes bacterium]|nr:DUF1028 domain-containing protein [Gemmatimonadota bacterium]
MRRLVVVLILLFALESTAFATWSVIAVDRSTGRVVIASATCTGNSDDFLKDLQAVVVPGKGVAACQAAADGSHQNQTLVFQELEKGTDPKQIIELLSQDPGFQRRQFGIVDLQGRTAGHSGLGNNYVTQDIQGQIPGTEIFYSIQGNILRPGEVVPSAVKAFVETQGGITDRVMAAMEAADAGGGDGRCTCQIPEVPAERTGIACTDRTALVAYILAADPGDMNGPVSVLNSHNNGKYAMYLTVSQGSIRPGENLNPVKTLRMRYDAWIAAHREFRR